MDPSTSPWRVLESRAAPTPAPTPAGETGTASTGPAPRAFLVSPFTAGAVIGAIVLIVAAFLLASTSAATGAVTVQGGSDLATNVGTTGTLPPDDRAGAGAGAAGSDILIVEIAGAVRRPGVFHLPLGSRIGDLIAAAGGYGPRVDAIRASHDLNLAARLADGDHVYVPSRDEAASSTSSTAGGPTGASEPGTTGRIELNHATQAELEALPGIGPVTAAKIVTSREERAFAAVDDLRTRKLVGAKTFAKLKDLVSVR